MTTLAHSLALAAGAGFFARDVAVTRPVCLKSETVANQPTPVPAPFFVDWLTVSQVHPEGGLPVVDDGVVWAATTEGVIDWRVSKRLKHEGSFSTSLTVRCDGYRVELSGNLSRYGRPDNLFGFGVWDCIERANRVLALYGLPPFTPGQMVQAFRPGKDTSRRYAEPCAAALDGAGQMVSTWTGARISRIDITANYEAGSAESAHLVMQYLGTQHNGHQKGKCYPDGNTVSWGEGSRRQMWKAYVKHIELLKHAKKGVEIDPRVLDYTRETGIVRFEGTIRSNALTDMSAAFLGDYLEGGPAMGTLHRLFAEHSAVMTRAERSTDDLDELPRALRGTARDYLAGMDLAQRMSRATFYRHRTALLAYGLDIAIVNVSPFKPRVRVVELVRADRPAWYQLAA